ncbi:MAG: HAMP domain-containing sensor histidine kinase [Prevotella pectinovora]|uniref:sensor histidine kinase n=1 Tax=Prevotella pectinovora TaxID=1602169 RepID=UPI002E75CC95|nr:HAMP domain-containing sensor histidine kinase [Prevotella pectinovora]MEE1546124.1 HAMP domain-containing sensor histidine kinase [Prevotella pectinovora]
MKKKTIWLIAGVMGFSFLALLFLQLTYMDAMIKMKKEQLDESVNKALYQAARNLELNETLKYLEKEVNETERRAYKSDSVGTRSGHPDGTVQHSHQYAVADKNGNVYSSFELKTITMRPASMPKAMILRSDKNSISEATKSMREIIKNRYVYQKALLDEVVYNILYTASDKPLKERVNFKLLDQDLKTELMNNGVSIPYHFTVSTQDGREQYRCPDYSDEGEEYSYSQTLFRNDPLNKSGIVRIHFPDMDNYIFSSVKFMIPSIAFTIVLLITFIFTIVVIFRQKRYTEIKNDFINNMTHELKTPISSISLAAQMLSDDTVTKSPVMMKHLGGVINDESKRLRFLVEKVLQMSMFDRKKAIFKKKELDLNDLAENVANTFTLRVEHTGGHIQTQLNAKEPTIYVDEMHFTNVIFNLLDNAVKYKHPDRPVELMIKSWNEGGRLYLSVKDNGIGLKKENLKKIFEKFYRVHTGNVHDVKGFGLGLAYVKKIVELHKGEIHVESERGKGTTFIISLPEIKSGIQTGADE